VSLLHALGMPELAATTPDAFVSTVVELTRDPDRLNAIRAGLRDRMSASPIRDEAGFTRALEAAYVKMCIPPVRD
jgi:predicted O-linked N-acetylglucosamine transferase (SPINDLY family)